MPKLTNQKKLNEWSELYLGNFNACLSDFLMREIADKIGTDVDIAIIKIPNKQERQQVALNHSSDIDFKGFINLYNKCTGKAYSFLVIDAALASDNPSRFRNNLLEKI